MGMAGNPLTLHHSWNMHPMPDPGNRNQEWRLQDKKSRFYLFLAFPASQNHECHWLQRAALLYGTSANFQFLIHAFG
jgi:hypothetical protein